MSTKFIRILAIAGALALAGGATAAVASVGGSFVSSPAQVDVKGPCDEAEHANDPQCAGEQVPEDDAGEVEGDAQEDDNSGPGENSGPGNAEDRNDHQDNSGPGSDGDSDSDDDSGQDGDQGEHEDSSGQDGDQGESGSEDDD